jgi:hypothetical protein
MDTRRCVSDGGDPFADADCAQCLDGLRTRVDGGADLAQGRGGLENLGLHTDGFQRLCGRKSGESASDNRYPTA